MRTLWSMVTPATIALGLGAEPALLVGPRAEWALVVVAGVGVLGALVLAWRRERAGRAWARVRAEGEQAARSLHERREHAVLAHHEELNRLGAAKMRLEIDLLELQLKVGKRELESHDEPGPAEKAAADKQRRELEMLEVQIQLAKRELAMRHDSHDYHDAMIEKARLEIESLKLHIKEQRKRLDEFGTYSD